MDPVTGIGLAASIVGLLALAKPLVKQLGPSAHGQKELSRMVGSLIALRSSYEGLNEFLESSEGGQFALQEQLQEPREQCLQVVTILRARIESTSFIDKFILGSKWDGKFDKCMKILDDAKDLFNQALQSNHYILSSRILTTVKESAQNLQDIMSVLDLNTETISELAKDNADHQLSAKKVA